MGTTFIKKMQKYFNPLTEKLKLILVKPIFFLFSWKDVTVGHKGGVEDFFILLLFSFSWESERYFGVMFYHHYFLLDL